MSNLSSHTSEIYLAAYGSACTSVVGEIMPDFSDHIQTKTGRLAIGHALSEVGSTFHEYVSLHYATKEYSEIDTYLNIYNQVYFELLSGTTEFISDSAGYWDADFRKALTDACKDLGISRDSISIKKVCK